MGSTRLLSCAALVVALCLSLPATEATTKWHPCGSKSVPVRVEDVEMSPDPPMSGHNFTLLLPAQTSLPLRAGSVLVSISYYGVPIRDQVEDLCAKVRCPVEPGAVTFRHVQSLPYITPPGLYSVRLAAVDTQQAALFCADVSLKVVRPPSATGAPAGAPASLPAVPRLFLWR